MIVNYDVTTILGPNTRPARLAFTLWTDNGGIEGECRRELRAYLELRSIRINGEGEIAKAFKLQSWEATRFEGFDMVKFLDTANTTATGGERERMRKAKTAKGHPNVKRFSGVLAFVDQASDRSPGGARGHKVILPRRTAENALNTLIGMGVNCNITMDGHDIRRKCGVIDRARIVENRIEVEGYLYKNDFPEVVNSIRAEADTFGMSYEITDCLIANICDKVWQIDRATFTGASILRLNKVAYKGTSIQIVEDEPLPL